MQESEKKEREFYAAELARWVDIVVKAEDLELELCDHCAKKLCNVPTSIWISQVEQATSGCTIAMWVSQHIRRIRSAM